MRKSLLKFILKFLKITQLKVKLMDQFIIWKIQFHQKLVATLLKYRFWDIKILINGLILNVKMLKLQIYMVKLTLEV
jgi:hypothetical protein